MSKLPTLALAVLVIQFAFGAQCAERNSADAAVVVCSDFMRPLIENLNALFLRRHPESATRLRIVGADNGVNALTAGVAALAAIDRVAWELERRPFRVTYGQEPLGIRIGRHGVIGRGRPNPPGIYVNARNPLAGLDAEQVARIFTTGSGSADFTHWNQVGLSGDFGARRIHAYGLRDDGGFATNTRLDLMGGFPFAQGYEPFTEPAKVLRAVADDLYGIGFADFTDAAPPAGVRLLPLAKTGGAPFVLPSYENVMAGRYPYSPYLYFYVERKPGQKMAGFAEEFARMALSPEGQAIIAGMKDSGDGLVPLTADEVLAELAKLGPPAATDPVVTAPIEGDYRLADGSIRIVGTNTMENILRGFNDLFMQTHPDIRFSMQLRAGLMAIGPITYGVTPFAPMPREFTAVEGKPYVELVGQDPLIIRVAHGSVVSQTRTASLAVYVNKDNPIEQLSVEDLARIFTTGHPKGDLTHWGQLGLTGEWVKRPIHPAGTSEDSGFGSFMLNHKMGGRPLTPNQEIRATSVEILKLVGDDAGAIGFSATNFNTPQTKTLKIAEAEGGTYSPGGADDVMAGRFPLDRYTYLYVRKLPGRPIEPWIRDYLRLILSPQGQAIIAAEPDGYLPLNANEIAEERTKIE